MFHKDIIYAANRKANDVFQSSNSRERILQDGYTRVDPLKIAASEGITVLLRPLKKLLGAYLRDETPGILINTERSAGLIHMTCAHELGHFHFGHQNTADDRLDYDENSNRMEIEADWFAYQLMAPRLLIAQVMKRKNWTLNSLQNPAILYQFSLRLGISYTAAAWSLHRHDLIGRGAVDKLICVAPRDIKRGILGDKISDARTEVWVLDENDRSSILEPRTTDHMVVRLKNNAAAGFLWTQAEAEREGFTIEPLTIENRQRPGKDSVLPVGQQNTLDYLVASKPTDNPESLQHLRLKEHKPWRAATAPNAKFDSRILFESLDAGLTPATKDRLLKEHMES